MNPRPAWLRGGSAGPPPAKSCPLSLQVTAAPAHRPDIVGAPGVGFDPVAFCRTFEPGLPRKFKRTWGTIRARSGSGGLFFLEIVVIGRSNRSGQLSGRGAKNVSIIFKGARK